MFCRLNSKTIDSCFDIEHGELYSLVIPLKYTRTGCPDAPAVLFCLRFLWFTCNYQAFIISTALWSPFNTSSTWYLNLKGKRMNELTVDLAGSI